MEHSLVALLFDLGDTIMIEESEIKDAAGTTLQADLLPGAAEMLRRFKAQGHTLGLVADSRPDTPINVLRQHGLLEFFDTLTISEVVGASKPDPQIFRVALKELCIPESDYGQVVMVGNNLERDIVGANRLGLISVYFYWNDRRRSQPLTDEERPQYTVTSIAELVALIEKLDRQLPSRVTTQPCEGLEANSPGNVPGEQNCVHLQARLQPSQGLAESLEAQNRRQALPRPIEIVCHRMANEHAPENTFAAAQLCVDWGVDYVEADVWTSRDGVFYLMHDFTVDRTTNGTGYILALTSSEIDRLDAGSWFGPEFAGEKVPRLEDFLRWIKGKAKVFLDVKFAHPQQLIDLLYATEMAGDCFLWCQSAEWMRIVRVLDPRLVLKVNVRSIQDVIEAAERYRAQIVEVGLENMSPELIAACRERGLKIMVNQTEKDPDAFRQVLQWGADMINLDHADVFLEILKELGKWELDNSRFLRKIKLVHHVAPIV